ncbi:MAG: HAD-IA family hydrolase [Isosphaeraceae bacterium]
MALFDDALPTLEALGRSGLRVRIGSNFDGRLRPIVRGLWGMSPYADSLVISSEVGWRKPHPGFYEAACRSMGLESGRVLFVGDDAENDYQGPRRCGIPSLLLDRTGRYREVDERIGTLADLVDRIAPRGN